MGCPALIDTPTTQPLYPRLRKHFVRGGGKSTEGRAASVMNTVARRTLRKKGFIFILQLITLHRGTETQHWNLQAGTDAEAAFWFALHGLFGLLSYTTQDHQGPGMAPPTMDSPTAHCSWILSFFLSDDSWLVSS